MKIIPFEQKYLDDIRAINVAVSTHPNKPDEEKKLCQYLYIDYYALNSTENCFVAIDNDEVVGYIIAESNLERYANIILNEYLPIAEKLRSDFNQYLHNEVSMYKKWVNEYDSHLHMDVKPGHQHKGIGTALIQHELQHLKNVGCKGTILLCSKTNERANNFYEKNNMKIIDNLDCYIRGKKL